MTRSLLRPVLVSLALLGALALASSAQDDPAPAPSADAAKDAPEDGAADAPKDAPEEAPADAPKDAEGPRDFSGKYLADGVSNGGRGYKAMVEITREGD